MALGGSPAHTGTEIPVKGSGEASPPERAALLRITLRSPRELDEPPSSAPCEVELGPAMGEGRKVVIGPYLDVGPLPFHVPPVGWMKGYRESDPVPTGGGLLQVFEHHLSRSPPYDASLVLLSLQLRIVRGVIGAPLKGER